MFPFPIAQVTSFPTPRGERAGVRVRIADPADAAEFVATSNFFRPVEDKPSWL